MTDSHSGILEQEAREKKIHVLPMPFIMNGTTYYEGVSMTRSAFYEKLREGVDVATSQPSPQDVMEMWDEMLKEYDEIVISRSAAAQRIMHDRAGVGAG